MRANLSAKLFEIVPYGVNPESGLIDYDRVRELALETRPLLILAGHSSYPRKIDFRRFREIADEVGALFMVDMAHFAGLVAGGVFEGDLHRPRGGRASAGSRSSRRRWSTRCVPPSRS